MRTLPIYLLFFGLWAVVGAAHEHHLAEISDELIRRGVDGPGDPCKELKGFPIVVCYCEVGRAIADQKGIAPALRYVDDVAVKEMPFPASHLVLHHVGQIAYQKTHDVAAALKYMEPFLPEFDGGYPYIYDGYRHGIYQSYFEEQKKRRAIIALIKDVCGEYGGLSDGDLAGRDLTFQERAKQCFHGAGHGAIFARDNDVPQALGDCKLLSAQWQRQWCYMGVFMEIVYIQNHGWMMDKRQPLIDDSPAAYCNKFTGGERRACAIMVGRFTYKFDKPDIMKPFDECRRVDVDSTTQRTCITDYAEIIVATVFGRDVDMMKKTCRDAGQKLGGTVEGDCLSGIAWGMRAGSAGFENMPMKKVNAFCDSLNEPYRSRCHEPLFGTIYEF